MEKLGYRNRQGQRRGRDYRAQKGHGGYYGHGAQRHFGDFHRARRDGRNRHSRAERLPHLCRARRGRADRADGKPDRWLRLVQDRHVLLRQSVRAFAFDQRKQVHDYRAEARRSECIRLFLQRPRGRLRGACKAALHSVPHACSEGAFINPRRNSHAQRFLHARQRDGARPPIRFVQPRRCGRERGWNRDRRIRGHGRDHRLYGGRRDLEPLHRDRSDRHDDRGDAPFGNACRARRRDLPARI